MVRRVMMMMVRAGLLRTPVQAREPHGAQKRGVCGRGERECGEGGERAAGRGHLLADASCLPLPAAVQTASPNLSACRAEAAINFGGAMCP